MGSCLKKLRTPTLDENALIDLIEDTKLNQAVLQGWYEEFIELFPKGVAHEEAFVEFGKKVREPQVRFHSDQKASGCMEVCVSHW